MNLLNEMQADICALESRAPDFEFWLSTDYDKLIRLRKMKSLVADLMEAAQRVADMGHTADFVSGVCCCGISMDRHEHRAKQNHAPVDTGERYGREALESLDSVLSIVGKLP